MARQISEIRSLPFYELIGAPLLAIIQGQSQASQATAEFIERIGFEKDENAAEGELGKLRMVSFNYQKEDVNGSLQNHIIQLPLLSLIPIPALEIKDASLEYNIKINDVKTSQAQTVLSDKREENDDWLSQKRIEFMTTMGKMEQSQSRQSSDIQMKVKMNIEQADIPVGLSQLFKLMDESIHSRGETIE